MLLHSMKKGNIPMKKIVTILLTLAMVFSLAACGGSDAPATEAPAVQVPETQIPQSTQVPETTEAPAAAPSDTPVMLPTGEPVELTWGSWAFADPAAREVYQSIAQSYNESNPYSITVDASYTDEDYLNQLLFDAASGTGPDIAQIPVRWLPHLLELGVVRSLDGCIAPEVRDAYPQSLLEKVSLNGELVALPLYAEPCVLLVNTELCLQAQVDPAAIATWSDLMDAANKVDGLSADTYGLGVPNTGESGGAGSLPALWAYGGEFQENGRVLLESDAALKGYSDLQKLYTRRTSPTSASLQDVRRLFAEGKMGFYWDVESGLHAAAAAAASEGEFYARTQAIPVPGSGYMDAQVLVVLDSCVDEEMAAAGNFLEFLSGAQAFDMLRRNGQTVMSGRGDVRGSLFGEGAQVIQEKHGYGYAFAMAMETAKALPTDNLHFREAESMLAEMLRELSQGGDAAQILAKWNERIQDVYND